MVIIVQRATYIWGQPQQADLLCCFHGCTFISDFEASDYEIFARNWLLELAWFACKRQYQISLGASLRCQNQKQKDVSCRFKLHQGGVGCLLVLWVETSLPPLWCWWTLPTTKASKRAEGEPSKRGRTCSTPALPEQPPCGGTKAGCSSQNFVGVELVFKGFVALCYSELAEQVWQRVNDCSEWKGWFCPAGALLFSWTPPQKLLPTHFNFQYISNSVLTSWINNRTFPPNKR